jgi:hypothetical protein
MALKIAPNSLSNLLSRVSSLPVELCAQLQVLFVHETELILQYLAALLQIKV